MNDMVNPESAPSAYLRWWYEISEATREWLQANPSAKIPEALIADIVTSGQPLAVANWVESGPGIDGFRLPAGLKRWVSSRPAAGKAVSPPRQPEEDDEMWLNRVRSERDLALEAVRARESANGPLRSIRPGEPFPMVDSDLYVLQEELDLISEELKEAIIAERRTRL